MDVGAFLKHRTAFISQFYQSAASSFLETKRKIEAEEPPFEPSYSEEDHPPFISEWIEADQSLDVLGQMCVSLLSASLQLYLKEWQRNFFSWYGATRTAHIKGVSTYLSIFKKNGWFNGYKEYCLSEYGIDWNAAPVNLMLLEEITLVRNRVQHPDNITALHISHSETALKYLKRPFFMSDKELRLFQDSEPEEPSWLMPPSVRVTSEKLKCAINEVDNFCAWLEEQQLSWGKS